MFPDLIPKQLLAIKINFARKWTEEGLTEHLENTDQMLYLRVSIFFGF